MNFEQALEAMKNDRAVRRKSWHKNERVGIRTGNHYFESVPGATHVDGVPLSMFQEGHKGTGTRFPYFYGATRHGHSYTGWAFTATDLLAEDWEIIEPSNEPDTEFP